MRDLGDRLKQVPEGGGSFVLRPMASRDLPQVIEIERQSFGEPWSKADFEREMLLRYVSDLTVAVSGEKVLGYTVAWRTDDELHLANVAVREGYRERGIGRALVENVTALAQRQGVRKVFLEVRESNAEARRLYETLGFRAVGVKRHYYKREHEDAIVMRRTLEDRPPGYGGTGDRTSSGDVSDQRGPDGRADLNGSPETDGEEGGAG